MLISITHIKLKTPFKFFPLSLYALHIIKQLKTTDCIKHKTIGIWKDHYTMTLWPNEESMMNFVKSGAHRDAMKKSSQIASQIRFYKEEGHKLFNWKEAKQKLNAEGRILNY